MLNEFLSYGQPRTGTDPIISLPFARIHTSDDLTVTIESVTPFRKAGKVLGTVTRFTVLGINTHHCNTCGSSQFALLTSMRSFQPDLSVVVCDRCGETKDLPDSLRSVAQSVLDTLNGGGAGHE